MFLYNVPYIHFKINYLILFFLNGTKHHHHRMFNLKGKVIIVKVIRTLVQVLIKVQQFCFICFATSGWGCQALPVVLLNAKISCKVKMGWTQRLSPLTLRLTMEPKRG